VTKLNADNGVIQVDMSTLTRAGRGERYLASVTRFRTPNKKSALYRTKMAEAT
jgi:hypothetical protein